MKTKASELASTFVASLMMGQGQFCTSPGLWVAVEDEHYAAFEKSAIKVLSEQAAGVMLTRDIKASFQATMAKWQDIKGVSMIARGLPGESFHCQAALFTCDLETFVANVELQNEVFGASALIIKCKDKAQMLQLVSLLKGNLTASIHADEDELGFAQQLSIPLAHKVGRLIFNEMPTGVEVCASMIHGGPFPAATDVRTTSVGSKAIERFRRPICYQNIPQALLPDVLKD